MCDSSAATSPVPSGSISPPGARGAMGVGGFGEGVCAACVCFGMSRGKTGAGHAGVERLGGGSCFDVSADVLVLGEAGLVR